MQEQYVTVEMLKEFGIEVDEATVNSLLDHVNKTVEERIGAEITEALNDDQLKNLLVLQENSTDEQVGEWIAQNVPNYAEIVQDNVDITIGELADGAEDINQA